MSKFSVRKPLTVLVAVIIVLVLGFVSITRMTPDLMPNLDMPYVMVMTAYPGATPEEVEMKVSKPLEQSMSTLENVKEVQSTSGANYSMLTLQFTEDVNMDTISVDILQKINSISGEWDDTVQTPVILKLNPTMIPVSVAAVSYEGKSTAELSAFLDDTLMNKLEGIAGIASVSASGNVDTTLGVTLNQDKIDRLNQKIYKAVDGQFADAEAEISDGQSKLESGKQEIADGKAELEQGQKEFAQQTAQGSAQISAQQAEITAGKLQIDAQRKELQQKLTELQDAKKQLQSTQKTITELESAKAQLESGIAQLESLQKTVQQLEAGKAAFDEQLAAIDANEMLPQEQKEAAKAQITESEQYKQVIGGLATVDVQLQAQGMTREGLSAGIDTMRQQLQQVEDGLSQIDSALSQQNLKRSDVANSITELEGGIAQVQSGMTQLDEAQQQLESGQIQLNEAMQQLEEQKTAGMFQMSNASAQLISAESGLQQSQAQIDSGLEQMQEARKSAHKNTDLENILTMSTLSQILQAQNFSMPAGYVEKDGVSYLVSVGNKISNQKEMEQLVLLDLGLDGVDPIRVSDIADVKLVSNSDKVYANINGQDGILLSFSKQSDYATATAADNVTAKMKQLQEEYPGLSFVTLMDQGSYIYSTISSILQSLILGAVFAAVILFLFLKNIKPTAIVICSIPISVVFAFVLMYFSGITLNMISMAGLAVAVGMLVDNSVVVIENIYRLRNKGIPAVKSAIIGAAQVTGSLVASTLTTVCVFLPIIFVEGLTRQIFTDLALTMGYALLASLIVALTLVPSMSSRMLRKDQKPHKDWIMGKLSRFYEKTLRWALKRKIIVLAAALVLLVGSGVLALARGFIFMPEMESTELSIELQMPEEALLPDTRKVADKAIAKMLKVEGVEDAGAMLTSADGSMMSMLGGSGDVDVRNVLFYLTLDGSRPAKEVRDEVLEKVSKLDGEFKASDSMGSSGMMSMMTSDGITIRVYGEELENLQNSARKIAKALEGVEGTYEISDGMEETDPAITFIVDKQKAAEYGLTVAQVYQEVAKAITTENKATNVNFDGNSYDVVLHNGKGELLTPSDIKNYQFTITKSDGTEETVKLREIAEIKHTETLTAIKRVNQKRYLEVTAKIDENHNITKTTDAAKAALEDVKLPADCSYAFSGGNEDIVSSLRDLVMMLLLGVVLIYLIMVAQFQSLKHPFIIMFTIPLAFTGGLLALLITGMEVSVISMMGFVMLCGIIVNNGIVLVDYINQLRMAGVPKREALVEAGKTRMRPILMTTITTILGLLVMALGIGSGNQMMQPIAVVCIGGLIYATLLTLYIVPIIYDIMNRRELKRLKKQDLDFTAEEMLEDEFASYREQNAEQSDSK